MKSVKVQPVDVWPYSRNIRGYTVRDVNSGQCTIFVQRVYADNECIIKHEMRHCEGWDHPDYAYDLLCQTPL